MARPIDADELMAKLNRKKAGPHDRRYTEGFNDALARFRSMVSTEPTISPDEVRGVEEYRDTIIHTLHEHRMQMDESYNDSDFALGYAEAFKVVCMMPLPELPKEEHTDD